jgi:hypothetical protein
MNRYACRWTILFLAFFIGLTLSAPAQTPPASSRSAFKTGLRFEYLSQTIGWTENDQKTTSKLTSLLASAVLGYEIRPGFSLTALVGYASSTFDGLRFRELPFSIDFQGGGIGGLILGGELYKVFYSGGQFDVAGFGQFLAYLGSSRKWDIPDLAVEGTVEAKPSWKRASGGPVVIFRGWRGISPYLYPSYRYLWGTFEMKETVQELEGTEKKDIKGKSQFGLALGTDLELSTGLLIKGEAGYYPYKNNTDFSVMIKTVFSF